MKNDIGMVQSRLRSLKVSMQEFNYQFLEPGEFDDTARVNLEFSNSTHIRISLHQWMNNMTGDVPPTR
mgnify:CR=1 FL=1